MIIQEIVIENYLCYYDAKRFTFDRGLNIILGENGEGKTKFFEAVEWLLNKEEERKKKPEVLVSAKMLAEQPVGGSFRVRVSLTALQNKEKKTVTRQFTVTKTEDGCDCSRVSIEGIEETAKGERSNVDGSNLLEQIYPTLIRKYSFFKGESALNIFDSADTLMDLIQSFSAAKRYDRYAEKGAFLEKEAEKAVEADTRQKTKNKKDYDILQGTAGGLERERNRLQTLIGTISGQIEKLKAGIEGASRYVDNAEEIKRLDVRIEELNDKIERDTSSQAEDYTTALFDERWMLINFEPIHREFANKVNTLSVARRTLKSDFEVEKGIRIGQKRERAKFIPLPVTVPSRAQMEEMLAEKICKVCNTLAPVGSDAYNFMLSRLEEYLKTLEPADEVDDEPEELFPNDYTKRLETLAATHEDSLASLRGLKQDIKERFAYNEKMQQSVEKHTAAKVEAEEERSLLLGSTDKGADQLSSVLKDWKRWQQDIERMRDEARTYKADLAQTEANLQECRKKLDDINLTSGSAFLVKSRALLRDICTIFTETRETKFNEFVESLEKKSNEVFGTINDGAFTGEIKFKRYTPYGGKQSVRIELQETGGMTFVPGQALLTSMHISILFAISRLTQERHEEGFPMFFDAPTSSFGETKTGALLNIIGESAEQVILLLKDFLVKDETGNLSVKGEFSKIKAKKAMWVKLERPFDHKNLDSINTQVITL